MLLLRSPTTQPGKVAILAAGCMSFQIFFCTFTETCRLQGEPFLLLSLGFYLGQLELPSLKKY